MQDYRLILRQVADGPITEMTVQSDSAADALALAYQHHGDFAELWRNDELLCKMTYAKGGFWTIETPKVTAASDNRKADALV
jgi:hypothetical protein